MLSLLIFQMIAMLFPSYKYLNKNINKYFVKELSVSGYVVFRLILSVLLFHFCGKMHLHPLGRGT